MELQNKKRRYVEQKVMVRKEADMPDKVVQGMKKAEEKKRVRERARFEKSICELYATKKRIPKNMYLPNPNLPSSRDSETSSLQ